MNLKPSRIVSGARRGARQSAARTPDNDATAYLELQHREIEELFRQLNGAETEDRRAAILRTIADGLAIHTAIEEHHLCAAARPRLVDDVASELDDHRDIRRILSDIVDVSVSDPDFDAKLKALRDAVERHVQNQERKLFPKVRRLFAPAQLAHIAQKMRDEQATMEGTDPRLQVHAESAPEATLH